MTFLVGEMKFGGHHPYHLMDKEVLDGGVQALLERVFEYVLHGLGNIDFVYKALGLFRKG